MFSKSADVIDDSDEELERMDRLEEERVRLSKAAITDDSGSPIKVEEVKMEEAKVEEMKMEMS